MTLFDIEDKAVLVKDDINMVVNELLKKELINKTNAKLMLIISFNL